jgi:uncharacterized membrane protein
MDEIFSQGVHWTARLIEVVGVAIIVAGAAASLFGYVRQTLRRMNKEDRVAAFRTDLGRSILLGLEFLVAADIIATVALKPTLESLAVLAGIVLIRTFLSFSLEVEIEGRWPWQRPPGEQRGA